MGKSSRWLLAGGVIACMVAVAYEPASSAEKTGDIPVAFQICPAEGGGAVEKCTDLGLAPTYQVAPDSRLMIEQVSGDCGGDGEPEKPFRIGIVAETQRIAVPHWVIGIPKVQDVGGHIPLTTTRIYADPGSVLTVHLLEVPAFSGRFCRLSFAGQLVKP